MFIHVVIHLHVSFKAWFPHMCSNKQESLKMYYSVKKVMWSKRKFCTHYVSLEICKIHLPIKGSDKSCHSFNHLLLHLFNKIGIERLLFCQPLFQALGGIQQGTKLPHRALLNPVLFKCIHDIAHSLIPHSHYSWNEYLEVSIPGSQFHTSVNLPSAWNVFSFNYFRPH